jgi:glucokinase
MTALSDGLTVGVDLGGTKIAAGAVDPAGQIVCAAHLPTPRDPELILGAVIDAVRQIRNGRGDVRAIGIGAAGYVDEHRSTVHFGPNLSWRDRPVRALVEEAT